MKASKLRTLWIMFASIWLTALTCSHAIWKQLTKTITRSWVDNKMQQWLKQILHLVRVDAIIVNPHNIVPQPGQSTIIMCNHSSLYDIPLSLKAFPAASIRMLAKKELAKIPLMGQGMKASEFPFIDRHNRHQAIKNLAYVKELMESGIVMWIAPEGTRSKDGQLATFKKGGFITAIEAGAVIIPLGIRGAYNILPARTYQFNLYQRAEVHVGQPIDARQYTLETKEALIQKTHEAIQTLLTPSSA